MNTTTEHGMEMTRRGFLKLAAGSALGATLFSMPGLSFARDLDTTTKRTLRPVAYNAIPKDAIESANDSALIQRGLDYVIESVNTIKDASLRKATMDLIKNPVPTFMQEYTTEAARQRLYAQLSAVGLIDTSKIDEAHILPPFTGKVQEFKTAPGSGYMSHHPYPGGLCTHVSSNLHITRAICQTYQDVFLYNVNYDIAVAGQALHDNQKPFVFQWQEDGSSLKEWTIAGQGAHHVISIAESMYRGLPAEEIVAQACAHGAPTSKKDEADVVGWLKAAAIMVGKDPVQLGVLDSAGTGLPSPHHQEGYIVHLGDHDWVLTSPASQKSIKLLQKIAYQKYGMSESDLKGAKFNQFRNYVGSQLSFMYLNMLEAEPNGFDLAVKAVEKIILK